MKTEQWLAALAVFVACGKSAESKQAKKDTPVVKDDKPSAGGTFAGVYKVKAATMNGKEIDVAEAFAESLKVNGDGKLEIDFVRMTIELDGAKITVGIEQVFGSPGSATYCAVHATSEAELAGAKLTVPTIEAVASAGVVTSNDTDAKKDTAKCNASLKKGTYAVKVNGENIDLSTTEGDAVTLHLVPDDKVVDLKERAVKFAGRK